MNHENIAMIRRVAREELAEEKFRLAVDQEKLRIQRRRWWHVLLPYTITFVRRIQ